MKPKYTDGSRYRTPYKPSHDTNVRATFKRIQKKQAEEAARAKANAAEAEKKVERLPSRKAGR